MSDCIFCEIISGQVSSKTIYEDEHVLAFEDIAPKAPTHVLVIPKKHIPTLNDLDEDDVLVMGKIFRAVQQIVLDRGIHETGYRTVFNVNEAAGQEVFHIHLHVLGGRQLSWPPG